MPAIGFRGLDGENYSFEEALELCASGHYAFDEYPYALLKGMVENTLKQQQDRAGDYISATSIIHCLRASYLKSRTDFYIEPSALYPSFRGTLFHGLLEAHGSKTALLEEKRIRKWKDNVEIGGTTDSLEIFDLGADRADGKTHILRDWKTTGELPKWGPWGDHIAQLNIYRWLFGLNPETVIMEVTYFTMAGFVTYRLKDGTQRGRGKAAPKNDHWTDEQIDKFFQDRLVKLKASFIVDMPTPYALTTEEDRKLCNWCEVKRICFSLADDEKEAQWRREAGLAPAGTPADISPMWVELMDTVAARVTV